jgi:lysozyme family protein
LEPTLQFNKALEFTLRWEGGYVNDKDDPGGETKYGISKRAYPDVDIKNLTREQAGVIYKRDYWDIFTCDGKSFPDAVTIFDSAVNCGVARTTIWMDQARSYNDILDARVNHYNRLVAKRPLMGKYLKGWMNRINSLREFIKTNATPDEGSGV